jgi:hypothetical protein
MTSLPEHSEPLGIRFRWKPLELSAGEDSAATFCCRGCQGAYNLICSAGLENFYLRAERSTPTVTEASDSSFTEIDLAKHIVSEGHYCRIDILITGITCPSCVWLLERMLAEFRVSNMSASPTAAACFTPF